MRTIHLLALAVSLAVAGCMTGDKDPTSMPTHSMTPTPAVTGTPSPVVSEECDILVDITGFAFTPRDVEVPSGATVCWTNRDTVAHTVTFDHGIFDSGSIAPGQTVPADLEDGLHAYHCRFHSSMTGSTQVGPVEATPPPPATPTPTPTPTATPTGPATATVNILGFAFTPATVTVARGGSVTWTNGDPVAHTATANDASWDTGSLAPATGSKTLSFPNAGTFDYKCKFHSTMTGTVVVT